MEIRISQEVSRYKVKSIVLIIGMSLFFHNNAPATANSTTDVIHTNLDYLADWMYTYMYHHGNMCRTCTCK